jgi:predicted anti-sigma-YlaC factor YlaD
MSCSEVLAVLSEFIDGTIGADAHAHVTEHLRGCDWCERFGGRFSEVVETLRRELRDPDALGDDVAARLQRRLERER